MDKVYDFTLILQEYNYGAIGGTDLTYTSWFMLFTAIFTALLLYGQNGSANAKRDAKTKKSACKVEQAIGTIPTLAP